MKVLLASIFALIAVANAARLPEGSHAFNVGLLYHHPHAGLFMVDYIMKQVALPTATIANLFTDAFPDIKTGSEAQEAMTKVDMCLRRARNVTVCTKLNIITSKCMLAFRRYYEKRLPETSRDIPKLITDSYSAVIQHICNSKTQDFLELSNDCLYKPGTQEQIYQVVKTYVKKTRIFNATPTKANLCGILDALRPLIEAPIKQSCQSNVTVKAFTALYDASATPCKE